jgi:hypothetical protein
MPNGSLDDILHSTKAGTLDWGTRFRIAFGAAQVSNQTNSIYRHTVFYLPTTTSTQFLTYLPIAACGWVLFAHFFLLHALNSRNFA